MPPLRSPGTVRHRSRACPPSEGGTACWPGACGPRVRGTGGGSTPTNGGYHHRPPLGCLKANDGQRPTVHRPQRRRGHVAPGLLLPPSGSRAGERPVKAAACPDPQGGRFPTTTPGARPLGGGGSGCQVWKARGWEAPGDVVTGARLCPRSKTTCRWEAPGYFLSPRDSTLPTHTHRTPCVPDSGICSGRAGFRLRGGGFWWEMFKWAFPPPKFCPSLVRLVGFCGTWSFFRRGDNWRHFPGNWRPSRVFRHVRVDQPAAGVGPGGSWGGPRRVTCPTSPAPTGDTPRQPAALWAPFAGPVGLP